MDKHLILFKDILGEIMGSFCKFIVYGLVNPQSPDSIRYVGRSTSYLKRPKQHFAPGVLLKHNNYPIYRWIKKCLGRNIKPEIIIIENLLIEDEKFLNERETYWIKHYRENSIEKLLNCTDGGETGPSNKNLKRSEETKKRMSLSKMGNKHCLGRILSEETKKKISEKNQGKVLSQETRGKIREAKLGSKQSLEQVSKKSHKIFCLNNNVEYNSVRDLSRELGIARNVVKQSLIENKSVHHGKFKGYVFSYTKEIKDNL